MSLIADYSIQPKVQVEYRLARIRLGFIRRDFDTVWDMQDDSGRWVKITNKSRGARNEILNGAAAGSSYHTSAGLPATERFSGGNSVFLTKDFCHALSLANWEIAKKYITWDRFKQEVLRMLRTAGFWANTVSSNDHRFEFHNGESNGRETFGILVQPMTMGGSVVKLLDLVNGKPHPRTGAMQRDYVIEALGAEHLTPESPYIDVKLYQYLWSLTSNSVRNEIKDSKGNLLGWEEFYFEPLLEGGIRLPTLGTFQTSSSDTGWAARVPEFRVQEITEYPYPWIMRAGNPPNPYL